MPNQAVSNRISHVNGKAVTPLRIRPSMNALKTSRYFVTGAIRFEQICYRNRASSASPIPTADELRAGELPSSTQGQLPRLAALEPILGDKIGHLGQKRGSRLRFATARPARPCTPKQVPRRAPFSIASGHEGADDKAGIENAARIFDPPDSGFAAHDSGGIHFCAAA